MLNVGQPPFAAEAVVKGDPTMIHTGAQAMAREKAPDDGLYAFDDHIPHKVRKGDPVPEGATYYGDSGAIPPHVAHDADAIEAATGAPDSDATDDAPAKATKRGPRENTDGKGPQETLSATTTPAPTTTSTTTAAPVVPAAPTA